MSYRDTERDREVTIVERDSSGAGVIVGVVLAILAVLLVWWLFFANGEEGGEVIPEDVNVTVDVDEGAGG